MSAMPLLKVDPEKYIEFPAAHLPSSTVILTLDNVSSDTVAFKIKTTAPKNYLVRPSTGVVAPDKTQEIKIVLQPIPADVNIATDRFLVQAAVVEPGTESVTKEFWINIDKSSVQDQKLSVTYKKTEPAAAAEGGGLATTAEAAAAALRRPTVAEGGAADFEAKYNELLQYCLAVEKQKTLVTKELEALRQQPQQQVLCRACRGTVDTEVPRLATTTQGYELWHVVAVVVGAVLVLKLFNMIWMLISPERSKHL